MWDDVFPGLKRQDAQQRQAGQRKLHTGKAAMPPALYAWLLEHFLEAGDLFAWAFLTTAWNSMCRTSSAETIRYCHLQPVSDALGLTVPVTKADQAGAHSQYPKLLFANPLDVRRCCITAMACHLLCDQDTRLDADSCFFPGSAQAHRFGVHLKRALTSEAGRAKLAALGRAPDDFAGHSTRKAGNAEIDNLSLFQVSVVAKNLRANWALRKMDRAYGGYSAEQDAAIGRLLAGLDMKKGMDFLQLPPHFADDGSVSPSDLYKAFPAFRRAPATCQGFLRFFLASVVHHADALAALLPAAHPLFYTAVFQDRAYLAHLQAALITGLASPHMQATGMPPHLVYGQQALETHAMIRVLYDKAVAAAAAPVAAPVAAPAPVAPQPVRVPLDLFPGVGPLAAWRLYWFGDRRHGRKPYRALALADISFDTKRARADAGRRLPEWKKFCGLLLARLDDGDDDDLDLALDASEAALTTAFYDAFAKLEFPQLVVQTRASQWSVATVLRKLNEMERDHKRRVNAEGGKDIAELARVVRPRLDQVSLPLPPPPPPPRPGPHTLVPRARAKPSTLDFTDDDDDDENEATHSRQMMVMKMMRSTLYDDFF
jgi:hypothetical protein